MGYYHICAGELSSHATWKYYIWSPFTTWKYMWNTRRFRSTQQATWSYVRRKSACNQSNTNTE